MNARYKAAVLIAGLALGTTPALAAAHSTGHSTTRSVNAKKYGKLCQGELKKHVKGMKGTPFSQCVTAAAHVANGSATNPTSACKAELKKHVKGMKGTPFSQCVTAAAKA